MQWLKPGKDRERLLALLLFTLLTVTIQLFRGAFTAEFTAKPDEAAHFVTSLMVRDYIGLVLSGSVPAPMPWAMDYYMHYPKVALGHWPPGYYALQAIWWLVFPIGRASAIGLNTVMTVVSAGLVYALARQIRAGLPALLVPMAMLVTPVMQEAMSETMSDLPSLLGGVVVLWYLVQLWQRPGPVPLLLLALAAAATLLMKGTGAVLLLAIGLSTLLLLGRLNWRWLVVPGVCGALGAGWFAIQHFLLRRSVVAWGGIGVEMPWYWDYSFALAGYGVALAALGGLVLALRRDRTPLLAATALLAVSILVSSYWLRAMQEIRHWIMLLPVLLLLAYAALTWLAARRRLLTVAAAVLVAVLIPFRSPAVQPAGFRDLAGQVRLPARMLISAPDGWPEGSWIAEVALREKRPSSVIVRATKVFAAVGWNNRPYRLRTQTAEAMEKAIDGAGVETIILHDDPGHSPIPHHVMLLQWLDRNPGWKPCGSAGRLSAFCRIAPPRFPRAPIQIDLRDRVGIVVEEK